MSNCSLDMTKGELTLTLDEPTKMLHTDRSFHGKRKDMNDKKENIQAAAAQ